MRSSRRAKCTPRHRWGPPAKEKWRLTRRSNLTLLGSSNCAGSKLPTLKQFSSLYEVGENTVRAIMKQLDSEGLIVRRRKLGTYVKKISLPGDISDGMPEITILFRMAKQRIDYKSDLSPWNMDFIRIFENLASKQGYRVSLAAVTEEVTGETPVDQGKLDDAAGFLVLLGQKESQAGFVKNLLKVNRPVVICNYYNENFSGMRINEDWTWGTREILEHLQALGHRRIAFCSISPDMRGDSVWVSQREDAFVSQAALLGLPVGRDDIFPETPDADKVADSRGEYGCGLKFGRKLFSGGCKYTTVIAANLKVADGLADAARETGVVIPDDLVDLVRVVLHMADIAALVLDQLFHGRLVLNLRLLLTHLELVILVHQSGELLL